MWHVSDRTFRGGISLPICLEIFVTFARCSSQFRWLFLQIGHTGGRDDCEERLNCIWGHLCLIMEMLGPLSIYLSVCPSVRLPTHLSVAPTWSMLHPWNASFQFSFLTLDIRYDSLEGGSACRKAAINIKQNKRRQTFMPWVGFEPTILVFEQAKQFYALDLAVAVICVRTPMPL
jgi:hypothetical protein